MLAHCFLRGERFESWELDAIYKIDDLFIKVFCSDKKSEKVVDSDD